MTQTQTTRARHHRSALSETERRIIRNVAVLMRGNNVKAPVLYRKLGVSRQVFSNRLRGETPFTAEELLVIAPMFNESVEGLAGPTDELVARQNWKEKNIFDGVIDLRVIEGGGHVNGQGRLLFSAGIMT